MTAPLGEGLYDVPPGHVAAVVTYLEMRARPRPAPLPPSPLRLVRWERPSPAAYRTLFDRVGRPWLWFSRQVIDEARLVAIIHDPDVRIWAVVDPQGIEVGLLELDFREAGQCELSFFGLVAQLGGKGHGRWLMAMALAAGWAGLPDGAPIQRMWVHTCTLDDPRALGFYRAQGFIPYARKVEVFADPRGAALPPDSAPRIPLL